MQAVCADVHIIKAIPNRRFYQSNNLFIIVDTVQVEVVKTFTETFKQTTSIPYHYSNTADLYLHSLVNIPAFSALCNLED